MFLELLGCFDLQSFRLISILKQSLSKQFFLPQLLVCVFPSTNVIFTLLSTYRQVYLFFLAVTHTCAAVQGTLLLYSNGKKERKSQNVICSTNCFLCLPLLPASPEKAVVYSLRTALLWASPASMYPVSLQQPWEQLTPSESLSVVPSVVVGAEHLPSGCILEGKGWWRQASSGCLQAGNLSNPLHYVC